MRKNFHKDLFHKTNLCRRGIIFYKKGKKHENLSDQAIKPLKKELAVFSGCIELLN